MPRIEVSYGSPPSLSVDDAISRLRRIFHKASRLNLVLAAGLILSCCLLLWPSSSYKVSNWDSPTVVMSHFVYEEENLPPNLDWSTLLPPDVPDQSELLRRKPSGRWERLVERKPGAPCRPHVEEPFPTDLEPLLYPEEPPAIVEKTTTTTINPLRLSTFAKTWTPPKQHEKWKQAPKVQLDLHQFQETSEQKKIRNYRREIVKNGFVWAWEGYKAKSWGHDEVKPLSSSSSDPFNGWGATIIDSLDTLLLMGLPEEYSLAREHIRQLSFEIISGFNWKKGSVKNEFQTATEEFDRPKLPIFETTIRYLGGLLAAYDLTGDQLVLDRAEDLAKVLMPAFDTPTGLPYAMLDPGNPPIFGSEYSSCIAEVGSMSLEFTRLSQLTGNKTYFEVIQRVTDYLDKEISVNSPYPPLIPKEFNSQYPEDLDGTFTFGGQADSYYEYLIKMVQLLNGALPQYARMYEQSIDRAYKTIIQEVKTVPGKDLLTIGQIADGIWESGMEHLTCFAGAMLGLGARLLNRPKDLKTGERVTETCYFLSAATKSGVQPEKAVFYKEGDSAQYTNYIDEDGRFLYSKPAGVPFGVKSMNPKYIGRPESIESVFYMYRLTGDKKWQDIGWSMFTKWVNNTMTDVGFASITDVRRAKPLTSDNMESFVLAETFKYHYLLQSSPDLLSLDDYVLNTEAHPFITNHQIKPGSQGFWDPSIKPSYPPTSADEASKSGEGTHVQRWAVHNRKFYRPPTKVGGGAGRGGGGGLGGGDGRPGIRPRPGKKN